MICPTSIFGLECSGHGNCWNIAEISEYTMLPSITYGSNTNNKDTIAWDYNITRSCVCNSSWSVGYEFGQYQLSEYFSPDCSLSKCYCRI